MNTDNNNRSRKPLLPTPEVIYITIDENELDDYCDYAQDDYFEYRQGLIDNLYK